MNITKIPQHRVLSSNVVMTANNITKHKQSTPLTSNVVSTNG